MARNIPAVTLPITPGKIRDSIEDIVERLHPRPRGENYLPVHDLEQDLVAYAGELVRVSYDDAGIQRDARQRLARHLYLTEHTDEWAPRMWDLPQHVNQEPYLRRADAILAVITGKAS
ncbi:hypothetical protein ABZY58_11355 [Micromonospora tulbaghiae]|uniref:hypothetical protein n=1 Tax=Micromonospora tulbaghiae TaxID=479978 RepID=UPI0033B7592B